MLFIEGGEERNFEIAKRDRRPFGGKFFMITVPILTHASARALCLLRCSPKKTVTYEIGGREALLSGTVRGAIGSEAL